MRRFLFALSLLTFATTAHAQALSTGYMASGLVTVPAGTSVQVDPMPSLYEVPAPGAKLIGWSILLSALPGFQTTLYLYNNGTDIIAGCRTTSQGRTCEAMLPAGQYITVGAGGLIGVLHCFEEPQLNDAGTCRATAVLYYLP